MKFDTIDFISINFNWVLFATSVASTFVLGTHVYKTRGQGNFISVMNLLVSLVMMMNYFANATFEYETLINTHVLFTCLCLPVIGFQTMLLSGLSFDQYFYAYLAL
jgi:hypothetical protein